MRTATLDRVTRETSISVTINLDGNGIYDIQTGVGFLDHMLEQLSRHSLIDITVRAKGDTHIDDHHLTEDCGLALGMALNQALGDRVGIRRYGDALVPMDETLVRCALDLSNRPYLVWRVALAQAQVGTMDTELFHEWFQAFTQTGGITLHIESLAAGNTHHVAEACYKALARALRIAVEIDPRAANAVPSTKGVLGNAPC